MRYLLFNPLSGHGNAEDVAKTYALTLAEPSLLVDMTKDDVASIVQGMAREDSIVLFGGDGTLNCFVNMLDTDALVGTVYYLPTGTGNDFFTDLKAPVESEPVEITKYLRALPVVKYNDEEKRFINGVGYGIDGYCCEVGDAMKAQGKIPNYAGIAIKGLLFHYKPCGATVVVDGVSHRYERVWIAPTMLGGYYGGGMKPAPGQNRENGRLSLMVFHGSGKLRTLMIFPSIFSGKHVKHKKYVDVLLGEEITVTFDESRPMQIDGETVLGVKEYTAHIR
ncbi:MAG: diacylglycerol kinase family protein [Clostridia bacterium]|nr:diacylglycerol kinase family protein [Clostridia bacterium]